MRLVLAAALAIAQFGCYSPDIPYGAPCAEGTHACPSGQQCDLITNTCQPPLRTETWRDDNAEDFAQGGPVLADAIIEANGAIGPMPYLTGRVRFTGVQGDRIPADPTTAAWDVVSAAPPTGHAFSDLNVDYGTSIPDGLGFAAGDDITILVEGELDLPTTGVWRFELDANDRGFLEIADPGTGGYSPVTTSVNAPTIGDYTVATPGWHKFRAAFSDAGMFMSMRLRYDAPGGSQALRDVASQMMRTRVDDLEGYVADGFEDAYLIRHRASTLVSGGLDQAIPDDAFGMAIGASTWSVRFSGQMLIESGGTYSFRLRAHQGARAWIDGTQVADEMGLVDTDVATTPMTLDAGWHDVVVDVMKLGNSQPGSVSLAVESGPALTGETVPAIRPVTGRGVRFASAGSYATTAIPDGATASRSLTLDLPTNMTPRSIDTHYTIDHPLQAQVSIVLDPPNGNNITQLAAGSTTGTGPHSDYQTVPVADAGATWTWIAGDSTVDTMVGNLTGNAVTIVYSGGAPPFPATYRYESSVRTVPQVVSLGALRWQLRQGSSAKVYFRTCALAPDCANEPWTEVENGTVPAVESRPFFQYAVDFTSDGDTPTALDWIEQDVSARPLLI